ncbi:MAG: IS66 family transposase [Anaerolineae bacterium]
MFKYTPNWLFCWIELGLPAWIRLLLALCLLLAGCATDGDPWASTTAAPWYCGRPLRPRAWGGRWGWAAWTVWRSRWHLLARCGLMLTLLAASGARAAMPWTRFLAWLPLLDGLLTSGRCVGGRSRGYQGVQWGVRKAYQLSVGALLLVTGLRLARATWGMAFLGIVEMCERDGSRVTLEQWHTAEDHAAYRVHLQGEFVVELRSPDPFAQRLFMLFLRQLRTPGREQSPWGIVRQEALARVFEVKQEHISRWQGYLQRGEWARLLSMAESSWLNEDRCREIVAVWAPNIWQSTPEVRARLQAQGQAVTLRGVEEAGRRSGLQEVRRHVKQQYVPSAEGLRSREGYVVEQLFRLVEQLEAQLQGAAASQEERVDVGALRQLVGQAPPGPKEKPWPWLFQVEHWLLGAWQAVPDDTVHCPYCGSSHVARKSRTPRVKAYLDAQGHRQTVDVYRYYCKNPACAYQTFTHLPPGLVVHSPWSLDARLKGLEVYMGLRSGYRQAAAVLNVSSGTVYHWLAQFGSQPLQIAALFGMVRSSGVVGIDEKYVKIPKNDKPPGKLRTWMYVYVAVDMHTLDLLHIDVFPYRGSAAAQTFLLGLRAKGYHPQVIVTDLCGDYADVLATVFPQATHHECVFHALQAWHRQFRDHFGADLAHTAPEILGLRQRLDAVFAVKTRRTVAKRYAQWLAQCQPWLEKDPRLQPIVDSVARHYPRLVNAYDRPLIPLTNNATERLIRRFDQHYQNFAGFDSLATARIYLQLFELTYRFTPFGREAQPHLRGRCPLELAGYDLSHVPLARYLREHSTAPLCPDPAEVVPR